MEIIEGAALAYIRALHLWVVVNNRARVIIWTGDVKEADELDSLIDRAHRGREAKVIRLQKLHTKEQLVQQLRGTEVAEVETTTLNIGRSTDHGTDTKKVRRSPRGDAKQS